MKYMQLLKSLRVQKNMNSKRLLVIVSIVLVFITIYIIRDTYGLFESKNTMVVESGTAKWNVLINGTDITSNDEFVVDNINILNSDNVKEGTIAPGCEGYFDIVITPDSDVSILYSVTFDFSNIKLLEITNIEEVAGGNLIKTGENTYSNVITLDEIKEGVSNTVRVYLKWINDSDNDYYDSMIGMIKDNFINIPISVEVMQYLGEEVEEYQNE